MLARAISATGTLTSVVLGLGFPAQAAETPPFWTYQDFQEGKIPQTYTIRKGHPRLLITPENKGEIVEKIKAAPRIWQRVIQNAEKGSGEQLVVACGAIYQLGLVPGFSYAMNRDSYGRSGVAALMQLGEKEILSPRCGLAFGYDWLCDLLSDEQKRTLAQRMAKAAPGISGEGGNCMRGLGMVMGLAFHGDGVDDAAAAGIVEKMFRDVWWSPKVDKQTFLVHVRYLEGGGINEGVGYYSRHPPIFPVVAAWKTATGQDYFTHLGYFRTAPYWMAHTVSPRSEAIKGDYWSLPVYEYSGRAMWPPAYDLMTAASTGYLREIDPVGASLARWWVDHGRACRSPGTGYEDIGHDDVTARLVFGLLIGDPRVRGESPAALGVPKTLVMRGLNNVYMRSAWGDPDATALFFGNTRARMRASASNEISLWKNGGGLFVYRGTLHHHNYWHGGGWPLNSVVFFDGRTRIARFHSTSTTDVEGTLLTASQADEYDFARGACPKVYVPENARGRPPGNIKQAERTVVYLRPSASDKTDHVVILDRVDSDSPSKRPHVVFNTVFEPRIARDWDAEDKGQLVVEGQWAYQEAACVTVTNEYAYPEGVGGKAHARAFLKTLYPREIKTLKSGGEKHPLDDLEGTRDSTRAEGLDNVSVLSGGYWRFHVVPTGPGSRHTILTAIEATDSKVGKPGALELVESDDILGARAGPNIVLFSKAGGTLSSGSVEVNAPGTVRIVMGDLSPGVAHTLRAGGASLKLTSTEAGTLFAKEIKLSPGDTIEVNR